jgi:cyclase
VTPTRTTPTAGPPANYRLQELGDGLWAAIAQRGGRGVSNSALVDLGGAALVFDTGLTPSAARDLAAASEAHLHRPVTLAANSHWHFDHSLGNQAFAGRPIWSTRRTREIMLENRDQRAAELTRTTLEAERRELQARRDTAPTEAARQDAEIYLGMTEAILDELEGLAVVVPDRTFETHVDLPGERGARLLSFGAGHTEADALLYLPRERVLHAGDLVCIGLQPSLGSGDPRHWLTVLDEIDRIGAERIIPGHGPVAGPDGPRETREYVAGILAAAEGPEGGPLPAALRKWEGSLGLEANLTFARAWLARERAR